MEAVYTLTGLRPINKSFIKKGYLVSEKPKEGTTATLKLLKIIDLGSLKQVKFTIELNLFFCS